MPSLLKRLKERKLFQWALAYLAGAWLVFQGIEVLAEPWNLSEALQRTIHVLLGVGFLVTLVLAWYHGEKGRQRASGIELVILAGILVIAGTGVSLLGRGEDEGEERVADQADPLAQTIDAKSVAVLPFANLSGDPDNEYFSDGMTGDIINHLVRIADLKVISRTSAMQYKNTDKNLRQIGQELGVATIVEGEVQRVGDRVRINAQLIDANTDVHLWAEQYNRQVEDVFEVQSDIARQIAVALQVTLASTEKQEIVEPTESVEAYEYFVRGEVQRWRGGLHYREAAEMYQRAVELDPDFAAAWAALAYVRFDLYYSSVTDIGLRESGVEALDRAVELAPDAFETHFAQGHYARFVAQDPERALEHLSIAESLRPNDAELLTRIGATLQYAGRWDEALTYKRRAAELDPRSSFTAVALGHLHHFLGDYAEAERYYDRAIALDSLNLQYHDTKFNLLLRGVGDTARARRFAEDNPDKSGPWLAQLDYVRRDYEQALAFYLSRPRLEAGRLNWLSVLNLYRLTDQREPLEALADSLRSEHERQLGEMIEAQAPPVLVAYAHTWLGYEYGFPGDFDAAAREARTALDTYPASKDNYNFGNFLSGVAAVYVLAGRYDEAIDVLETSLSVPRTYGSAWLRLSPFYDPLRNHPRFQAMLAKYE